MSDFNETEAFHLGDIYAGLGEDNDGLTFEECVAEAEYEKASTLATLVGLDEDCYTRQIESRKSRKKGIERKDRINRKKQKKGNKDLFIVIQDSRKDDTTLMLVDRRKSKEYWWTHDFSLAYKGSKEDMERISKRLNKNNARVIGYKEYLNSL